jgi:hypothetical protein
MRRFVREQRKNLRLEENLRIASVGPDLVNDYINRARLSLFTSDVEGLCRSVLQTLLAERWVLCYRHTRALTRLIFDKRYFRFYDHQTEDSIGETAWQFLQEPHRLNRGARDYLLKERQFVFHDLAGWQEQILAAAVPLSERDGQHMDRADVVPIDDGTHLSLWREFRLR